MSKKLITIIIEAIVVGLVLVPISYIAGWIAVNLVGKPSLPDVCKQWNDRYIMEINLFLAGFMFHILCQVSGVNKWYVDYN